MSLLGRRITYAERAQACVVRFQKRVWRRTKSRAKQAHNTAQQFVVAFLAPQFCNTQLFLCVSKTSRGHESKKSDSLQTKHEGRHVCKVSHHHPFEQPCHVLHHLYIGMIFSSACSGLRVAGFFHCTLFAMLLLGGAAVNSELPQGTWA